MKTKNLMLTILMVLGAATMSFSQTTAESGNWMNSFSTTEYFLMAVTCLLVAVIWLMGRTIKTLSDQLR